MKITTTAFCLALLFAGGGCKKKYGAGCERAVDLTAPWTELALPIDGDETRICESGSQRLKLRSYRWKERGTAAAAFDSALAGAGLTKDRCNQQACYYVKGDQKIGVQPMDFRVGKKRLVTVVLTAR